MQHGLRVLLGFDFCYGYPAGYAAALGLTDGMPPWRRTWNEITGLIQDSPTNANNRFAVAAALNTRCAGVTPGPLWGSTGTSDSTLPAKRPRFPYQVRSGLLLEEFRQTERWGSGGQPVWKLLGSGSVGGQTLLGIPAVCGLRDDPEFAAISRVWPFETGFTAHPTPNDGSCILHAEIYPALVSRWLDPTLPIRDQAQVRAMVRWLAHLDAAGLLNSLFAPPEALSAAACATCIEEEGWMLGAGLSRQ
jgi:precorrin-8X/cobalt-precorrin-8 methylmutase